MTKPTPTIYVREIIVNDPDTGQVVSIEIHKDPESGGLFGIDSSFLDQVSPVVRSPFNEFSWLSLSKPES